MNWVAEMVQEYRKQLLGIEFFQHVKNAKTKNDFAWVRQLLHQSTEFLHLLNLRHAVCTDAKYREYFGKHAAQEVGHYEMLENWMVKHGLLTQGEDVNAVPPTVETTKCVGFMYRLVLTDDELAQLIGANAVSEGVASDFFSIVAPILRSIGMGDQYWEAHVNLDVDHSATYLEMIPAVDRESALGQKLAQLVHDAFVLNAYMLNSWIGVQKRIDLVDVTRELVVA